MFDFTIKRLDNIKFNVNELIQYFNKIESDYQHLCWRAKDSNIDRMTHKIEGVYSWAIQTNLKDINKPCPPYHIELGDERLLIHFPEFVRLLLVVIQRIHLLIRIQTMTSLLRYISQLKLMIIAILYSGKRNIIYK